MKDINVFIYESELDDIVARNLAEISDQDITEEVRDYTDDSISQVDILNVWNELKAKIKTPRAWIVTPCADIDEYGDRCVTWAKQTLKKYNVKRVKDVEKILTGIAWVVNSL